MHEWHGVLAVAAAANEQMTACRARSMRSERPWRVSRQIDGEPVARIRIVHVDEARGGHLLCEYADRISCCHLIHWTPH